MALPAVQTVDAGQAILPAPHVQAFGLKSKDASMLFNGEYVPTL